MVSKRIKLRDVADLSINKINSCYFNEGNLQVVINVKDLKITSGH